jgi:uncharacterized membrane protein YeaQ/YmgE (transglycosylase-associated protein family)
MGIFGWIVVGFVAGALARSVSGYNRKRSPSSQVGCLGTIAVGIAGALIGGALANMALDEGIGEFGLRSIGIAFVGALILLLVVDAAAGRSR